MSDGVVERWVIASEHLAHFRSKTGVRITKRVY